MTGLVIGSLTPDFEYFLRMKIQSDYSHSIGGLFWFDLPLGIILAFVFHHIVRNSLFDNLPVFLKSRFQVFRQFEWNRYFKSNWIIVIISVFIGAASHLFWDSFTHPDGYFVSRLPFLTQTIEFWGKQIPMLKILQHGSTILGGLFIAYIIYKLPKEYVSDQTISLKYWGIVCALVLIIIIARLCSGLDIRQYGNLIVTGIAAGLIAVILTPLFIRKKTTEGY